MSTPKIENTAAYHSMEKIIAQAAEDRQKSLFKNQSTDLKSNGKPKPTAKSKSRSRSASPRRHSSSSFVPLGRRASKRAASPRR